MLMKISSICFVPGISELCKLQAVRCGRRKRWRNCSHLTMIMLTRLKCCSGLKSTLALTGGQLGKVQTIIQFLPSCYQDLIERIAVADWSFQSGI